MRKRGKYGLTNTINTCKIGSFPTDFVGNLEWGFLKLPSSRDAAAAWTNCQLAAGPAAPAVTSMPVGSLNSYPQEKERKDWNGLHLMI